MTTDEQPWEILVRTWKSTDLAFVMVGMIRLLLDRGEATVEECGIQLSGKSASSVPGAAVRSLRRLGIAEKESVTYGTTEQGHGHTCFRWRLKDRHLALCVLNGFTAAVLDRDPASVLEDERGQLAMNL